MFMNCRCVSWHVADLDAVPAIPGDTKITCRRKSCIQISPHSPQTPPPQPRFLDGLGSYGSNAHLTCVSRCKYAPIVCVICDWLEWLLWFSSSTDSRPIVNRLSIGSVSTDALVGSDFLLLPCNVQVITHLFWWTQLVLKESLGPFPQRVKVLGI